MSVVWYDGKGGPGNCEIYTKRLTGLGWTVALVIIMSLFMFLPLDKSGLIGIIKRFYKTRESIDTSERFMPQG